MHSGAHTHTRTHTDTHTHIHTHRRSHSDTHSLTHSLTRTCWVETCCQCSKLGRPAGVQLLCVLRSCSDGESMSSDIRRPSLPVVPASRWMLSVSAAVRAHLPRVRAAQVRPHHDEPGSLPAPLQRGAVLDRDRDVPHQQPQQEGAAAAQVHQDRLLVSPLHLYAVHHCPLCTKQYVGPRGTFVGLQDFSPKQRKRLVLNADPRSDWAEPRWRGGGVTSTLKTDCKIGIPHAGICPPHWKRTTFFCCRELVQKNVNVLFCFSCKDYQNLNSFFAIVMGLSNIAVSRLSQTWEVMLYQLCEITQHDNISWRCDHTAFTRDSGSYRSCRVSSRRRSPTSSL